MKDTFEDYLMLVFDEQYHGCKDDEIDAFEHWIENLSIEDWLSYGDLYAHSQVIKRMDKDMEIVKGVNL